jgi:hypothetical protein
LATARREPWKWYALLVVPFFTTLCVPLYDRTEPTLGGWPFFYWYLFVWVFLTGGINAVVYLATRERKSE